YGAPVPRPTLLAALGLPLALTLAGCAPADEPAPGAAASSPADGAAPAGGDCTPDALATLAPGTLTVATSEPAFEPWVVGNDPTTGEGFEAAVAHAVAEQLGYAEDQVAWVRADFNAAIAPGPKTFDVDVNQFSITEERAEAVDFSSGYYTVQQAVVADASSPAAGATSLADLQGVRLGAQVGTTSLQTITETIAPTTEPSVYTTNDDAVLALQNGQVDALVVDLPTAFYLAAAELDDGVVVGQVPPPEGVPDEEFGLVLELDSPLTGCVSGAVDALREDGTLAELEQQWLAEAGEAPILQ
ncbi:MAG: ABC transporter, substrate-binding protein (cluster 3, basic aa/glutamine/opines), partial [uncultured Quadrisphaera sp.]